MSQMQRAGVILAILATFAFVASAWLNYPNILGQIFPGFFSADSIAEAGQFGDSFGALNTLFSGLAFSGIIISIVLQSIELRETRKELSGQREQFEIQSKHLGNQIFENTFFNLVEQYIRVLESTSVRTGPLGQMHDVTGRDVFETLYGKINGPTYKKTPGSDSLEEDTVVIFKRLHGQYYDEIGGYMRTVYHVLKFVETSEKENGKFYTSLFRAQLSSSELAMIFYNCLSPYGSGEFKRLVEKYSIFEHLPVLKHLKLSDAKIFDPKAFGDSAAWREFLVGEG